MSDVSNQQLREDLIRQIQVAFSDVKYERVSWHTNPAWQLQGKHWNETPEEMLQRDGFIYSVPVSDDGQFFLPAYIVTLLRNPDLLEGHDTSLLDILAPKPQSASDGTVPFAYLTKAQRLVVLELLEAYPKLFPHLFTFKTYSLEVQESIRDLMSQIDFEDFRLRTPYEIWEEAITFWRSDVEDKK